MKSVKTITQATRLAAQSGGTLTVGGRVINAAGGKLPVGPTKSVQPAEDPKPVKVGTPITSHIPEESFGRLADMMALQTQAMTVAMRNVVEKIEPAAIPMAGRQGMWPVAFLIERDDENNIIALSPEYGAAGPSRPVRFDQSLDGSGLLSKLIPVGLTPGAQH